MPISKYFKGSGSQVMKSMQGRYGADKGKSVFYATANKNKMTPDSDSNSNSNTKNKKKKKKSPIDPSDSMMEQKGLS